MMEIVSVNETSAVFGLPYMATVGERIVSQAWGRVGHNYSQWVVTAVRQNGKDHYNPNGCQVDVSKL